LRLEGRELSPDLEGELACGAWDWSGTRICPDGVAVKTKPQRVHCTDAPAGGSSRGSRSYCIEH